MTWWLLPVHQSSWGQRHQPPSEPCSWPQPSQTLGWHKLLRGQTGPKEKTVQQILALCNCENSAILPSHLRGKHGGAGADTPAHDWLCDPASLNSLTDLVLFCASDLWDPDRVSVRGRLKQQQGSTCWWLLASPKTTIISTPGVSW